MPLSGEKGYIDPILTGIAVDYSANLDRGLIARQVFTPVPIDKDDGKYPFFGKENYDVPDDNINDFEGKARRSDLSGELKPVHCVAHALKEGIDRTKNRRMDGPFKTKERDAVRRLVYKLMLREEMRVAAKVAAHTNGQTLAGTGAAATNQWDDSGGDPFSVAKTARASLWFEPNALMLSYDVYLALKHHTKVIDMLGANEAKIVTAATLAELFEVQKVLIGTAQWTGKNRKADKSATMSRIWSKLAAFAYVTTEEQEPTAEKIFLENIPGADSDGFLVRTWHDPDSGVEGTDIVQTALVSEEQVVAADCLYVVKNAIA